MLTCAFQGIVRCFSLQTKICYFLRFYGYRKLCYLNTKAYVAIGDEKSYIFGTDDETVKLIKNNFLLCKNFVSEDEERNLMNEIDPIFKRRRYEYDHWDDAIHGYKETEKLMWNEENQKILNKVISVAFGTKEMLIRHVHVLDLAKNGYIKPHIDSIRFCGDTIAGISLLSSSVMRLVKENNKALYVDILLERRSLYIMKDAARYEFTHEILSEKESLFNGTVVPRDRRVSIICRNEPVEE